MHVTNRMALGSLLLMTAGAPLMAADQGLQIHRLCNGNSELPARNCCWAPIRAKNHSPGVWATPAASSTTR